MKSAYKLLGILGGTFDPVHCGHLHIAESCDKAFHFDQVLFIPNKTPPHRVQPIASANDRLNMVKIAIANHPNFVVNTIEINQNGPSYAIQTLRKLYKDYSEQALCFILGTDAFASFNLWHGHEEILNYCHLIIVNRPDFQFDNDVWLQDLLNKHLTDRLADLQHKRQGYIYLQLITPTPTSATETRARLATGLRQHIDLPEAVKKYIEENGLYKIGV